MIRYVATATYVKRFTEFYNNSCTIEYCFPTILNMTQHEKIGLTVGVIKNLTLLKRSTIVLRIATPQIWS